MPIIALQPWSQFTRTDDAPIDAAGLLVFRGGVTVPLILRMSDANGTQELEQAVEVDGQAFPCGAVLTASSDALAPDARQGHVLTLNDTPIGICLEPEQRLRPGDVVTVSEGAAANAPKVEPFEGILCFATGTLVDTSEGPRRVETLRPGEIVEMGVSFYVDPDILEDRNLNDITTITLSYALFRATDDTEVSAVTIGTNGD